MTSPAAERLERLRALRPHLGREIIGQDMVLDRMCSVLLRGELGLAPHGRPRGSFLLVGPTGVGKTESVNVFSRYLFAGADPIRFDMSEYQNQSSVEKLLGAGLEEAGLMGRALGEREGGVLLFDEIEKAHPLVLDLFLQMLGDAVITFSTGERRRLDGFYIVCTSNIGSAEAMRMHAAPYASIERTVMMRVGQELRPELVGRFTEKLVFNRLDFAAQKLICRQMVEREVRRLNGLGFAISLDETTFETCLRLGFHKTLGARPLRGVVERQLQEKVVATLL